MNTKLLYVAFVLGVIISVNACEDENKTNHPVEGKMISHSSCKGKKTTYDEPYVYTPDTLSCVKYDYEPSTGKLILTHRNAGFNCCPDSIYGLVSLSNDTILIEEKELYGLCDCDCLYDLNFEITGIEAKVYIIRFVEPYWRQEEKLIFEVDLSSQPVDSLCMTRTYYPWNMNY